MDGLIPILVELGKVEDCVVERLRELFAPANILALDPEFAYHPGRGQHHSTELLARLPEGALGVAAVDLYIPILEFVFGEAQLGGRRAVISTFRLRQEFYGLPADPGLMVERAIKEALHEWGHALGLRHCPRYDCAMHATHSVELLDLKGDGYCPGCAGRLRRQRMREAQAEVRLSSRAEQGISRA